MACLTAPGPIADTHGPMPLERTIDVASTDESAQFFSLSLELFSVSGQDGYFRRLNPAFKQTPVAGTTKRHHRHQFVLSLRPYNTDSTVAFTATLTITSFSFPAPSTLNFEL